MTRIRLVGSRWFFFHEIPEGVLAKGEKKDLIAIRLHRKSLVSLISFILTQVSKKL